MANKTKEEDMEELESEEIRNRLKPIAHAHFIVYYKAIAEALYQQFASLTAHKMSNLMYREGRLNLWVAATGIKSPADREKEKANKKRNKGEQYGIGSNSTDYETVFHIQVIKM